MSQFHQIQFQIDAAKEITQSILQHLHAEKTDVLILQAPTGAGKTLITTEGIKPILGEAAYIWMSYYPDINAQSAERIRNYEIPANSIEEISSDNAVNHLERGTVYFVNFQKLAPGNTLEKGGDNITPFKTLLQTAKLQNLPVVVIIDEAHYGASTTRERNQAATILENILVSPDYPISVVLGVTATPVRFKTLIDQIKSQLGNPLGQVTELSRITHETVKSAKLLKADLEITTTQHPNQITLAHHAHAICRHALPKWKEIRENWQNQDDTVYPLLIIQIPDKFDSDNTQFPHTFAELYEEMMGERLTPNEMRHCFSGTCPWEIEYISPQDIQGAVHIKVVFFKTALNTGWDCPRAEMMISLRNAQDETAIVQLVGRMLRNPNGLQIENPLHPNVNVAFLYLPFYDENILKKIEEEYGKATNIRANKPTTKLEWNPVLEPLQKEITNLLEKMPTARRIWKSKNLVNRVKEFQGDLRSLPLRQELDIPKLDGMLESWRDALEKEIVNQAGTALQRLRGHSQLDALELRTLRLENPIIQHTEAALDPRDERRCFRQMEIQFPKMKEGVSEDVLRNANTRLKNDPEKNPDGLRFPILILAGKKQFPEIVRQAIKACKPQLEKAIEEIRDELGKGTGSKIRREMRSRAKALTDLDSFVDYQDWEIPTFQTCQESDNWLFASKCIHNKNGKIPPGSIPENCTQTELERDLNVIAYLRNPQKGNGLGIRYLMERSDQMTFPDFIAITGNPTETATWKIRIIECKGGENRETEKPKYVALANFEKLCDEQDPPMTVTTEWQEWVNGSKVPTSYPSKDPFEGRLLL